ncbi:4822_t:CDS:2 [Acaulospora morrowiae]|uniref:4822_t:CDS:1 n=1 Tax=Acaulospora morrowiae TaxID=94023 RepID=A0A9N9BPR6_9GLOM|nr:4822_t:CDS:2 [Acaulospora morrowiae]
MHEYLNESVVFGVLNKINGVTGTFKLPCHSSLYAEPENQHWGTGDLYACLMFKSLCRPNAGPIGAQARKWEEIHTNEISVPSVHLHHSTFTEVGTIKGGTGTISDGTFGVNCSHKKRDLEKEEEKEYAKEWNF